MSKVSKEYCKQFDDDEKACFYATNNKDYTLGSLCQFKKGMIWGGECYPRDKGVKSRKLKK